MSNHGTPLSPGQQEIFLGAFLRASLALSHEIGPATAAAWSNNVDGVKEIFRRDFLPPVSDTAAKGVVKTTLVMIGGGRTTDQIIETARNSEVGVRPSYINPDITQANMPSGNGHRRPIFLEWFEFDHDPTTEEVRARCEEPGYGYAHYGDGLRFQEDNPNAQCERPHIVIPEEPWCDANGHLPALALWCAAGRRKLYLDYCGLAHRWRRDSLFARRKYV